MSEKQKVSDTVTVLPPSPYGICFDLKTDRFQLEETTRSGSFDMKYRHSIPLMKFIIFQKATAIISLTAIFSLFSLEVLSSLPKTGFTKPLLQNSISIAVS